MSSDPSSDPFQTRLGVAALAACIVRTLGASDPAFQREFEATLEQVYRGIAGLGYPVTGALETLRLTREILYQHD